VATYKVAKSDLAGSSCLFVRTCSNSSAIFSLHCTCLAKEWKLHFILVVMVWPLATT
jgi:putative component of membrane protein insertase Oxa1/YidC/SpoIIIJ protein YidD